MPIQSLASIALVTTMLFATLTKGPATAGAVDTVRVTVKSTPAGLPVRVTRHQRPTPNVISRSGVVEDSVRGQSPLELQLEPGTYTIALEQSFAAGAPAVTQVPRGCIENFSFSGSTVFFQCFKCKIYAPGQATDSLDPYLRDGNVGMCFDAPTETAKPIRYFRLYSVTLDSVDRTVTATFRRKPAARP